MAAFAHGGLLGATRAVIILSMVVLGLGFAAIVIASAAMPFVWQSVLAEIAKEVPRADTQDLQPLLYGLLALLALFIAGAGYVLLKLLQIIRTVAEGDPFTRANAVRLKTIGWVMTAGYLVGYPLAFAARAVADRFGEHDFEVGVSLSGILAILLVFVLAGVFEQGAAMREDMEGTV